MIPNPDPTGVFSKTEYDLAAAKGLEAPQSEPNSKMPACTFRIAECRSSIRGIGVVWPVEEVHGLCGCGHTEMKSEIAFFRRRCDADTFCIYMRQKDGR